MLYLREFAEVTGHNYERILKKEAQYFIDYVFDNMEIVSRGEIYSSFGSTISLLTGKKLRSRNVHFEFRHDHCHAVFNEMVPYDNNILLILRHEFKLDKEEVQDLVRRSVKRFLKENDFDPMKKIKVLTGSIKGH